MEVDYLSLIGLRGQFSIMDYFSFCLNGFLVMHSLTNDKRLSGGLPGRRPLSFADGYLEYQGGNAIC
jgi:hypothetical protein